MYNIYLRFASIQDLIKTNKQTKKKNTKNIQMVSESTTTTTAAFTYLI